MKAYFLSGTALLCAGLAYMYWPSDAVDSPVTPMETAVKTAMVDVRVPESFSPNAQLGQKMFDSACATCHGANAAGQDGVAPPLVHKIYEPSHHGDESFQRAAALGVRAHHWPFGDMPKIDGFTRGDVTMIIAYIRELQRANGIN